jgi:hypothetical protein
MVNVIAFVANVLFVGVALGALLALDAPPATKLLVFAFAVLLVFLLIEVGRVGALLREIKHVARAVFVSVETARLEPKSNVRALDRLTEDLETEREGAALMRMFGGGWVVTVLISLVYVVCVGVVLIVTAGSL